MGEGERNNIDSLSRLREEAETLDAQDELAAFRSEFYIPSGVIYLDGNSLGLMSHAAEAAVLRVLNEWKRFGVGGWSDASPPWFNLAEELAKQVAILVGTEPDETIVANSTTVNLHQLLATLLCPDNPCISDARDTILTDCFAFPSDAYAIDSYIRLTNAGGRKPQLRRISVPSTDGYLLEEDLIIESMTPDVWIILLPSVVYTSGQLLDMRGLTFEAHRRGILIGFDCSHSIGCVPHRLSEWGVDFAIWCSYKYLNGGPGATGGLYLNRRHIGLAPGLAGWFSSRKENQLAMLPTLSRAQSAGAMQIGTPNILSMAPLCGTLDLIHSAGPERIRRKSEALTDYLARLANAHLVKFGFRVITPPEANRRGGHIALAHPEAIRVCKALRDRGVIPDYRPPDIVRFAPVPLYTSFAECCAAVEALREIMESDIHLNYPEERPLIP